jgi:Tfp pilus assembly protein PilF/outer membrane protein assembly factor BamD (BamD/ComL family)
MKKFLLIIVATFCLTAVSGQVTIDQNMVQLATQYYNARDFEKAAPLFKDIYQVSNNRYYFRLFISSLTELQQYQEAEEEIRKEIRRNRDPQPDLLVHWGQLLKLQSRETESVAKYEEAIKATPANRANFINTGNMFLQWREFEWAQRLYEHGRKVIPGEGFHSELATVYTYLRNYTQMLEELLYLVKTDEANLPRVQSNLTSAMYLDIENGLRDEFRATILRRIQAEPEVLAYNRLLIWFFLQERQFAAALRQTIALDRRTGMEEQQILMLAQTALNNQSYQDASAAYDYILSKGKQHPSWLTAFMYKLHADYQYFTIEEPDNPEYGHKLAAKFEEGLEIMGYSPANVFLIREYAHLLAFYLEDPDAAIAVLEKGLEIPGLRPMEIGEIKTELADVYLYAGDPWEAILLYSQVIDANRNNNLGDEVKLKKARLGYYMGNFSWAKAQLDVLKASTSKLTANDAMELSLFISSNTTQDSIDQALEYFSRADFLFFRNKNQQALATLDSIDMLFPYHSIVDDVLFRKAKIHLANNVPEQAIPLLERIAKEFPYDLLGDDALYLLADTYNYRLNDRIKAAEAYRRILFEYPGSIFVPQAREKYRHLNVLPPELDKDDEHFKEDLHFRGIYP